MPPACFSTVCNPRISEHIAHTISEHARCTAAAAGLGDIISSRIGRPSWVYVVFNIDHTATRIAADPPVMTSHGWLVAWRAQGPGGFRRVWERGKGHTAYVIVGGILAKYMNRYALAGLIGV
jgi:hypothetical protein